SETAYSPTEVIRLPGSLENTWARPTLDGSEPRPWATSVRSTTSPVLGLMAHNRSAEDGRRMSATMSRSGSRPRRLEQSSACCAWARVILDIPSMSLGTFAQEVPDTRSARRRAPADFFIAPALSYAGALRTAPFLE